MSAEIRLRPLRIPSQETKEEMPQQDLIAPPIQEQMPSNTRLRPLQTPKKLETPKKENGYLEAFGRGLQRSASGELGNIEAKLEEMPTEKPGFWESVVEESGTLVGDTPWMGIGAGMGAALGTTIGGPIGTIVGGSAGAFAFPAFLKEASRQYRQFQDEGGDLTFGEFIQQADKVANKTLQEGAFGIVLGAVKNGVNLLRKIPAVDQLFNTKYIGSVAKGTAEIGAEVGTATGVPALAEGRLPTAEDAARAAVLFTGSRAVHLPAQLKEVIQENRSERFNYALADRVQKLDLAYPPLQEFRKNENPVYKNSVELDRNLTAFDESFINNIVSRVNSLSPNEFASADEAGRRMYNALGALAAVEIVPTEPGKPEPIKPVEREVPLIQNPLQQAMETISGQAAPSKAELGRRISRQYEIGRREEQKPLTERYKQQEKDVAGLDIVDASIADEIQTFIDRFEPGAIPGSQAAIIVANATRLRDMFVQYDKDGNIAGYKSVPMQKLISTNRSIKQIPNHDVPPEILDNLNTLTRNIDEAIYGQMKNTNVDLANEFQQLNSDYALFKNRWDNNDMRIFYDRTENSEAVANKFTNLDDFTQLSQAFSGTYEGQQVLNLIRREVWRDGLGRDALNARTEKAFEAANRDLTMRKLRDLMEYLEPQQREAAMTAMQRSNQIRTSAIRSAESFSANKEQYDKQMKEWREQEGFRKEQEKARRQEVQTKQELLVSLLQEDPAKLVSNMNTIEGIRRIKEASKKVAEGKELYDSLARYETEQMFGFMKEGYLRTGRVPYTEMKLRMKDKEFRAKLKELNGEKFVRDMDELVDLTDDLSKNFKETVVKFRDDPTTLNTILHIYSILGLAQGDIMTPLMAFTAKKNILRVGNKAYNFWSSRRNYDPKMIHQILNAARAAKKGNKQEIRKQEAQLNIPFNLRAESNPGIP